MFKKISLLIISFVLLISLSSCIAESPKEEEPKKPTAYISQIIETDDDGNYSKELYTYDELNRVTKYTNITYNNQNESFGGYGYDYVYDDENNQYTEFEYLYENDEVRELEEYRINYLNESGLVTYNELYRKNNDDEWYVDIICEYGYDEAGNVISEDIKYVEDHNCPIEEMTYYAGYKMRFVYENGRLKEETDYDYLDGTYIVSKYLYYYNYDGTLHECLYYYGTEEKTVLYEKYEYYYENSNLVNMECLFVHDGSHDFDHTESYKNDENGNCIEMVNSRYFHDEIWDTKRYTYEYDEYGNQTKETREIYNFYDNVYELDYISETTYIYK